MREGMSMLSNLKQEIKAMSQKAGTIIGFNVFGFEDAKAVIRAAEQLKCPTALMLNKLSIEHLPVESWAGMLRPLAEAAMVPVSIHLDHCKDFSIIERAIKSGFTSVMFDGSQHPLEENIMLTKKVVSLAAEYNVAVEGEIGSVPYADIPGQAKDEITDMQEAKRFAEESGVDWMAIAVGQVHRLQGAISNICFDRLQEIEQVTEIPLVIHGGSGIASDDLKRLVSGKVAKMNYGTGLRVAFGEALKRSVKEHPNQYDRLVLFEKAEQAVEEAAVNILKSVNEGKEDSE